jgi:hypothetical protein
VTAAVAQCQRLGFHVLGAAAARSFGGRETGDGWWCGEAARARAGLEGRLARKEGGGSCRPEEEEEGRRGGATGGHTGARRKKIRGVLGRRLRKGTPAS